MRLLLSIIAIFAFVAVDAFAGVIVQPIATIPTLSEWGMIAMFIILGIVGLLALRKRLAANSSR